MANIARSADIASRHHHLRRDEGALLQRRDRGDLALRQHKSLVRWASDARSARGEVSSVRGRASARGWHRAFEVACPGRAQLAGSSTGTARPPVAERRSSECRLQRNCPRRPLRRDQTNGVVRIVRRGYIGSDGEGGNTRRRQPSRGGDISDSRKCEPIEDVRGMARLSAPGIRPRRCACGSARAACSMPTVGCLGSRKGGWDCAPTLLERRDDLAAGLACCRRPNSPGLGIHSDWA